MWGRGNFCWWVKKNPWIGGGGERGHPIRIHMLIRIKLEEKLEEKLDQAPPK
jgi:hypothetical protein